MKVVEVESSVTDVADAKDRRDLFPMSFDSREVKCCHQELERRMMDVQKKEKKERWLKSKM